MAISRIPTLRVHIWQARSWQIYLPLECSFYRFLLWELIFGQPGLGRSILSLCLKWQFHRFLLWELIFGRPGLRRSTLSNGNFTDSYSGDSYFTGQVLDRSIPIPHSDFTDSYSERSYLAGQVLADLPPPMSAHFTDSYSESSYLDNQVLVGPPFSLCLKWQFHRFLLW